MAEYFVEHQYWAHWPKVLIMCRKRGRDESGNLIAERKRYVPENAYIAQWDATSVENILKAYWNGKLLRDVDRDTDVLIACQDRDELILELFEAALDLDECSTPYIVERFGERVVSLGIDVGDIGKREVMDEIRTQDKLAVQFGSSDEEHYRNQAREFEEKAEELRALAKTMGWEV